MADFKGGDVVVVPMPVNPQMVLWALPGPAGDIPYADVENLVEAEFTERIDTMTQLEADTAESALAATTAAGTATTKATAAATSEANALAYRNTANTAAGTATTQAGLATTAAETAEQYALEFDLGVTATTGAPGSNVVATVTGTGPAYQINLTIPRGAKGETGANGEISQAQLDAAVATLVDNAPEALNTLSELATSLGNDPNFATTVSTEIGLRAKTADVNTALAGKADAGAETTATWAGVTGKPSTFPPAGHVHDAANINAGTLSIARIPTSTTSNSQAVPLANDPRLSDARTPTAHSHTAAEVGAKPASYVPTWSEVSGKPSTFTPATHTHTKAEVGLGNVDNTSDAAKPVSTAQQAAINAKIQLVSDFPASPTMGVLYLKAE